MVAATPPYDLFFLAWVGLIPLFIALETPVKGGFRDGFTAGCVFNGGVLYWLAFNSGAPVWISIATMIAGTLVVALGWGIAASLFFRIRRRIGKVAYLFLPFSWVAWEGWLSYMDDLAFPWSLMALTQSAFDPILQVMEFTGVWGVSFWVVALNTVLYMLIRSYTPRSRAVYFGLIVGLLSVPFFALIHAQKYQNPDVPVINVLIVQGNVPPMDKWTYGVEFSWAAYDSLTRAGAEDNIDVAIWPEMAIPTRILRDMSFITRLETLADSADLSILTGASDYCRIDDRYKPLNGAFLIRPDDGIVDRYAKQWLVPFGERVPFQWLIPKLGSLNFGQAEFLPGLRLTLFEVPVEGAVAKFPALICYESAYPDKSRNAVLDGANLLATISNDAWYGRSSEAHQIAAVSRFRCIETRRAMARASNTGISLFIDPLGREIKRTNLYEPAWITCSLPLMEVETFYVRYGNLFLVVVTLIYGIVLIAASMKKRFAVRTDLRFDVDKGFKIGQKWSS